MYNYNNEPYNCLYKCKLDKKDASTVEFYLLTDIEASFENMNEFIMMIEKIVFSKNENSTNYTGLDYYQVSKSIDEIGNKLLLTDNRLAITCK